jgi:anti-sigma B factor antagonist
MSKLTITKRNQGNVVILDVNGRITLGEESLTFRDSVASVIETGSKKILANLLRVDYIDSSGLGELVSAYTMAARHGAVLKLVNMPPRIQGLLQMTKLITIFETFESEPEAVRSFATQRAASRIASP